MSDVPDEILREILSRLPVTPLLRFRCVSKSWKGLIDSNEFTRHHLNHSRKTNTNLKIIFSVGHHLYSAKLDILHEQNQADFQELPHPLEDPSCVTEILGSCDGLLVLNDEDDNDLILWNPSLRRFHEIPIEFPKSSTGWEYIVYGFGYDVVSDDYKLVRINQLYESSIDEDYFNSSVQVYSLKSGSWRKIPDFPYHVKNRKNVPVNGALHWIVGIEAACDTDSLVVAFDLGTEEYKFVPLPKLASKDIGLVLGVVGGCLCVMYCNEFEVLVDVWVMKEYGVQESWSNLFRSCDFHCWNLIAYSKCGRKLLLELKHHPHLMLYDLDKKSTELLILPMPSKMIYGVHTCLQSLVLLDTGTCDFNLVTKKKQKRNDHGAKTGEIVLPAIGRPNEDMSDQDGGRATDDEETN